MPQIPSKPLFYLRDTHNLQFTHMLFTIPLFFFRRCHNTLGTNLNISILNGNHADSSKISSLRCFFLPPSVVVEVPLIAAVVVSVKETDGLAITRVRQEHICGYIVQTICFGGNSFVFHIHSETSLILMVIYVPSNQQCKHTET